MEELISLGEKRVPIAKYLNSIKINLFIKAILSINESIK
jgi:hypothetical protein